MKRNLIVISLLVVLCSVFVHAQAPKPGAEVKKLGILLGSWSMDAEVKPGNLHGGPAGKITQVERYQWMPGEFFLQMNRDGKATTGDFKHTIIFGYDPSAKKYTLAFFDWTAGGSVTGTGTNNGNTWTW